MQPPPPPGFNPYAAPIGAPASAEIGVPAPTGKLSIDGAFGRAFETMKRFLFRPFDFGKLVVFGFIVWLAELGDGGANLPTNLNLPSSGGKGGAGGPGVTPDFADMLRWLHDNQSTIIVVAVFGGAVLLALSLVISWLSARGMMMALRAVAHGHTMLGDHWHATREAAWSYFGFRVLLAAIGVPVGAGTVVWGVLAFLDVAANSAADVMDYVRAIAPPAVVLILFTLLLAPVHFLGRNLLAPILLKFGGGLRAGWSRTMSVVGASFGGVLLFMLVRMLIAFVQGIAETMAIYVTCCIGGLPVVHQVLTAPFTAFERAYSMHVLESLGPEYTLILPSPAPPPFAYPPYGQPPPPPYPGYPPYGQPPPQG